MGNMQLYAFLPQETSCNHVALKTCACTRVAANKVGGLARCIDRRLHNLRLHSVIPSPIGTKLTLTRRSRNSLRFSSSNATAALSLTYTEERHVPSVQAFFPALPSGQALQSTSHISNPLRERSVSLHSTADKSWSTTFLASMPCVHPRLQLQRTSGSTTRP